MEAEYKNYLLKHKSEPFVMQEEIDLNYIEFCEKFKNNFSFRQMWKLGCEFNYYEIRSGKCENARVIKGKIICEIKCDCS